MTKPWERPKKNKKDPVKLTAENVKWARARARKAGRRYPNLVDNMAAARRQSQRSAGKSGSDSRPT